MTQLDLFAASSSSSSCAVCGGEVKAITGPDRIFAGQCSACGWFARRPASSPRWVRIDGGRDKFATWELEGTGYIVKHCGHPTANWPWYGLTPAGEMVRTGGIDRGLGFQWLHDAQAAIEELAGVVAIGRARLSPGARRARARGLP